MKALITRNKSITLDANYEAPADTPGNVMVRVHYGSLMPSDLDFAHGHYDWFLWMFGKRPAVRTGLEFSGTVLKDTDRFNAGDHVFGYTHLMKGPKTHREILSINQDYVALIPPRLGFAEAAAMPVGAQTSLVAWRDVARTRPGDRVLVNGGSGGVGVYAIQIAKMMGAHVTAIAGSDGQDLMKRLGADEVLNYREIQLEALDGPFNAIFDLTCLLKFPHIRHLLTPDGVFIPADPSKNITDFLGNPFRKQKTAYLMVAQGDSGALTELAQKIDSGALVAPQSRIFNVEDFDKAIDVMNKPGVLGRIVLGFGQ